MPNDLQTDEQALAAACQPYDKNGQWKLELKVANIGGFGPLKYGHSSIHLLSPDGRSVVEFHGYNKEPGTGAAKPGAGDKGDQIAVAAVPGSWGYFSNRKEEGDLLLAQGTYEDMKPKLKILFAASQAIDAENIQYSGWGFLKTGQNCNSVAHSLTRLLGQEVDPQNISRVILTGSAARLPAHALDEITKTDVGVDLSQLDSALSKIAKDTGQAVVMPDLDKLIEQPLDGACRANKSVEIDGVAYHGDGSTTPTQLGLGTHPRLRQPPDYNPSK